eukprot:s1830_g34.t1
MAGFVNLFMESCVMGGFKICNWQWKINFFYDWRDEPWEYKNEQYEAYYRRQGICSEEEFLKMLETLRTGLPVAIRVNRMRPATRPGLGAASLRERLEELAEKFSDPEMQCYAPQKLSWYSHGFGWMWPNLERRVIKKDQRHAGLKEYLAQRERAGLISRQEAALFSWLSSV